MGDTKCVNNYQYTYVDSRDSCPEWNTGEFCTNGCDGNICALTESAANCLDGPNRLCLKNNELINDIEKLSSYACSIPETSCYQCLPTHYLTEDNICEPTQNSCQGVPTTINENEYYCAENGIEILQCIQNQGVFENKFIQDCPQEKRCIATITQTNLNEDTLCKPICNELENGFCSNEIPEHAQQINDVAECVHTCYQCLDDYTLINNKCEPMDKDGDGFAKYDQDGKILDCNDEPGIGSKIYPGAPEVCTSDIDYNCNGEANDPSECDCTIENEKKECQTGLKGICAIGEQVCIKGVYSQCYPNNEPTEEICQDNIDNNCDGKIDYIEETIYTDWADNGGCIAETINSCEKESMETFGHAS